MKEISLSLKRDEIKSFFKDKNIVLSELIWDNLLKFLTKICYYEEEERKIFAHIVIGHNLETAYFKKVFQVEMIHFITEVNEEVFLKRLKPLLPFCNNGWRVYIDITENEINFGIMKVFSGIEGLSIDEVLKSTLPEDVKIMKDQYNISYILINPLSINEFGIVGMDGEEIRINFRLHREENNVVEQYRKNFVSDFIQNDSDERLKRTIKNIVDLFSQRLHGAICLIVNEECSIPNEQLCDGIFLEEPIDLLGLAQEALNKKNTTFDYRLSLNEKFRAMTELFIEMLNFDGITIVNNSGKILAYNVFVTPKNSVDIFAGGARRRAARALIECRENNYIGVYFQSQDGNVLYERVGQNE